MIIDDGMRPKPDAPVLSFVIVNWNTRQLLLQCLQSIFDTVRGLSFEIFVVDNGSTDGSVEAVRKKYGSVQVIANPDNRGFAAANNQALAKMSGRYAVLLNSDAMLTADAIWRLVAFMDEHPRAGAVCGQLLNADGSRQNSFANFPSLLLLATNESLLRWLFPRRFPRKNGRHRHPIEVDSCIGACMMVRRETMAEVGLLDERFFFFLEETDWALRMRRQDWQIYFVPQASIYHYQGSSAGHRADARKMFYRSRYLYFKKWTGRLYPIYCAVIFVRLLINAFLNLLGVLFTMGLNRGIVRKFCIYAQLIAWHLKVRPALNPGDST